MCALELVWASTACVLHLDLSQHGNDDSRNSGSAHPCLTGGILADFVTATIDSDLWVLGKFVGMGDVGEV